jgi:hypothetical protein
MHDFEPGRAATNLTVTTQPRAASHLLILRVAEMKEPQCQPTRAIANATQQLPPAAKRDLRQLHLAFDHCPIRRPQRADRHHTRAVLVPKRQ